MPWLVKCSNEFESSKTQFLLVMMQSLLIGKNKSAELFEVLFPALKTEWESFESAGDISIAEFITEMLNWEHKGFLDKLDSNLKALNANILICVFWKLMVAVLSAMPADVSLDGDGKWICWLSELLAFFSGCQFKHIFKEHRHYLVTKCKMSAVSFLSKYVTEGAWLPFESAGNEENETSEVHSV